MDPTTHMTTVIPQVYEDVIFLTCYFSLVLIETTSSRQIFIKGPIRGRFIRNHIFRIEQSLFCFVETLKSWLVHAGAARYAHVVAMKLLYFTYF